MNNRFYNACHQDVDDHGKPTIEILNFLIDTFNNLDDEVFKQNNIDVIYNVEDSVLGLDNY